MIKALILLTSLLNVSYSFSNGEKFPEIKDHNNFLPARSSMVIIHGIDPTPEVFGDLSEKNPNRIRKIPVSALDQVGITEGSLVQALDLEEKAKLVSYKVKKEVYVLMSPRNPMSRDYKKPPLWSSFTLILSDDPSVHEKLKNSPFDYSPTGFAYIGSKHLLRQKVANRVQLIKEITKSDPASKKILLPSQVPGAKIKVANVFNNKIYSLEQTSIGETSGDRIISFSTYLETPGRDPILINNPVNYVELGEWIDGYKMLLLPDWRLGNDCVTLYFFSLHKIEQAEMRCVEDI